MVLRILIVVLVLLLGLAFQAILQPPPQKLCGSPGGPPMTSPRIKLRDGRYLAYREDGVQKDKAKYKIITEHAFDVTKDLALPVSKIKELMDKLGIYLAFDRAGCRKSDPNLKRNVKNDALDIQELADQLEPGQKFNVLGVSMGGYSIWGCLQYIPNRLAGAALVAPIINYWWPSFPDELSRQAFRRLIVPEQRTLWIAIAHNIPSLLYLWMTQQWLPSSAAAMHHPEIFSKHDVEVFQHMMVMPVIEGSVHIWQGYKDRLVLVELQRYISKVHFKEASLDPISRSPRRRTFMLADGWTDKILRALLVGE